VARLDAYGVAVRIMFIGDSLAAGYFATTRAAGFSELTIAALREIGQVEPVTASKAGGNVKAGSIVDLPQDVDVVVVELGTNDSLHTLPHTFARQYGGLLRRIRETSPSARLVCLGLWRERWRAWPYDAAIRSQARRHDATFVPLTDTYRDSATRGPAGIAVENGQSDTFHPNDHGHRAIADRLLASLGAQGGVLGVEALNLGGQQPLTDD
jgi:acyl-CoA thioesterase-1